MAELRVVMYGDEPFEDRVQAGDILADHLQAYRGKNAVVAGIPRGGIVVAGEAARLLGAELDIVLSRKLRAPYNPELAVGAVSEDGKLFVDEAVVRELGIGKEYIEQERKAQLAEIKARMAAYRKVRPKVTLKGRIVIVTDDGIATGSTMLAALWAARQERPELLVAAVPVAPRESLDMISGAADETLCLRAPAFFAAVGQFYSNFEQLSDEDVMTVLRGEHRYERRR